MNIIGRNREKRALKAYTAAKHPDFLVVYGRRRVGKTFLIREYFENNFCFYCTGRTGENMSDQLSAFNAALNKYGKESYEAKTSWFDSFLQLEHLIENADHLGKKVIFIDEMPWLDTQRSGFLSALEYFWNSFASARPDILLIACGSATSWIAKKLFENTGGLFNRVTKRMYLKPFTLKECEEFFRSRNIIINRYHILESYMIFGGVPFYLDLFDGGYGFAQNVDLICFGDDALLRNEYKSLYATLFGHYETHHAIVSALAQKTVGMTREELLTSTALSNGGRFTEVLDDLELCGFIRSYHAILKKRKGTIYQLSDAFTLFYHRFLKDRSKNTARFWANNYIGGGHNAWSGYAFEQVCLAHEAQIKQALGIMGVSSVTAAWRSSASGAGTGAVSGRAGTASTGAGAGGGAQIDLVIDRADQVINLCEMKFSIHEYEIDKSYSEKLEAKIRAFAAETKTKKALHTTLVTTYGLKQNKYASAVQSEITMDDLFG